MAAIPACEKEKEVGIHRYLSSPEVCPGFSAVFKHRFTDFVVREVDLSERVAKLTDLVEYEAPEKKSEGENDGRNGAAAAAVADAPARTWIEEEEAMKELQTAIGAEDAARFADFVKLKTEAKDKTEDEHLVLTPNDDKDKRTAVHKFFKARQHLVPLISTDTLVKDETKSVRLFVLKASKSGKRKRNGKIDDRSVRELNDRRDDAPPTKLCRFLLYKENVDTQHALHLLSKHLHVKPRRFGFAGTKDKRGVTVQWLTGFRIAAKQLQHFNQSLSRRNCTICVGNLENLEATDAQDLQLGQLKGNHFDIILRDAKHESKSVAEKAVESLMENGFINYFGLQRFGTGATPTHRIGVELLKGHWEEACKGILKSRSNDRDSITTARKKIVKIIEGKGKDGLKAVASEVKEVLRMLPNSAVAEKCIANSILDQGASNLAGALLTIPRTLKLMYLHAYQSYLWNNAASKRLEMYSDKFAVEGDLVFVDASALKSSAEKSDKNTNNNGGIDTDQSEGEEDSTLPRVRYVTKEEGEKQLIRIDKVVLPLPGYAVKFPENKVALVYQELLEKDGISMTEVVHKVRDFSYQNLTGTYRSLIQVPKNVTLEVIHYNDPDEQLVITDLQEIQRKNKKTKTTTTTETTTETTTTGEGAHSALKIGFTLNASCYATMAVRELTRGKVTGFF